MTEIKGFERVQDGELKEMLDSLFLYAKGNQLVQHDGAVYRRYFFPKMKIHTKDKKVPEWDWHWEEERPFSQLSIGAQLDTLFPKAKSREIVKYQGKLYRRRFRPVLSRSGKTVHHFEGWWEFLGCDADDDSAEDTNS